MSSKLVKNRAKFFDIARKNVERDYPTATAPVKDRLIQDLVKRYEQDIKFFREQANQVSLNIWGYSCYKQSNEELENIYILCVAIAYLFIQQRQYKIDQKEKVRDILLTATFTVSSLVKKSGVSKHKARRILEKGVKSEILSKIKQRNVNYYYLNEFTFLSLSSSILSINIDINDLTEVVSEYVIQCLE